jgi:hypothetical protein
VGGLGAWLELSLRRDIIRKLMFYSRPVAEAKPDVAAGGGRV